MDQLTFAKLIVGGLATIALYSILYRENKFYRLFEHIYIGLAVGFSIVALWTENLETAWWDTMIGTAADPAKGAEAVNGMFWFALLVPIGAMGFMVFSKKHGWMSRIPIGIILGMWGGQQFDAFQNEFMPQVANSVRVIAPTTVNPPFQPNGLVLSDDRLQVIATNTGLTPEVVSQIAANVKQTPEQTEQLAQQTGATPDQIQGVRSEVRGLIGNEVYLSQAVNNIIYLITLLSVLSYFLFSFEIKGKFMTRFTYIGRLLLMVGFGAIFGSTVMTRFTLLIDRMFFIFIELLKQGVFQMK